MKVKYEFVNKETKEIEVDEKLGLEIKEIERQTYNSNQRETRRHQSFDILQKYDLEPIDENASIELQLIKKQELQSLQKALGTLNTEQRKLVCSVFFNEQSFQQLAKQYGTTRQALQNRMKKILNKLRKNF